MKKLLQLQTGFIGDLGKQNIKKPENAYAEIREALSDAKIQELRSLINKEKKTKALPGSRMPQIKVKQKSKNGEAVKQKVNLRKSLDQMKEWHSLQVQNNPYNGYENVQHKRELVSPSQLTLQTNYSQDHIYTQVPEQQDTQIEIKEEGTSISPTNNMNSVEENELTTLRESMLHQQIHLLNIGSEQLTSLQDSMNEELLPRLNQENPYQVEVNHIIKPLPLPSNQNVPQVEYKSQEILNYSSLIQGENKIPAKGLYKSQSSKDGIQLPKLKAAMKINRQDLEVQKQVIGKIISDQSYLLSMEYLLDKFKNTESDQYKSLKKELLIPTKTRLKGLHGSLQNLNVKPLLKPINQQDLSFKSGMHDQSSFQNLPNKSKLQALKPILEQGLQPLQKSSSQLINLKGHSFARDPNPLKIPQAYQDFLDSHRDHSTKNTNNHSLPPLNQHALKQSPTKDKLPNLIQMNLMRQKLSSSQGRKHFIVAYNLSETLKENRLELECYDYKKIKELITDISKKRFQTRTNNVLTKQDPMMNMSKDDIEKLALQLSL